MLILIAGMIYLITQNLKQFERMFSCTNTFQSCCKLNITLHAKKQPISESTFPELDSKMMVNSLWWDWLLGIEIKNSSPRKLILKLTLSTCLVYLRNLTSWLEGWNLALNSCAKNRSKLRARENYGFAFLSLSADLHFFPSSFVDTRTRETIVCSAVTLKRSI